MNEVFISYAFLNESTLAKEWCLQREGFLDPTVMQLDYQRTNV